MRNTTKINITSIEYKNDERAKENFISLIIDYLLDNNLIKKDGVNESNQT